MKISLQVTIANNGGDVAIIRKPLDSATGLGSGKAGETNVDRLQLTPGRTAACLLRGPWMVVNETIVPFKNPTSPPPPPPTTNLITRGTINNSSSSGKVLSDRPTIHKPNIVLPESEFLSNRGGQR